MIINKTLVIGTIIGALLVVVTVFIVTSQNSKDYNELVKQIKESQSKIDSIQNHIIQFNSKIDSLQRADSLVFQQVDDNSQQIARNNNEWNQFKKQYNAKILNIDNYTDKQLDSFFRARYGY